MAAWLDAGGNIDMPGPPETVDGMMQAVAKGADITSESTSSVLVLLNVDGINTDSHAAPQPDPRARREVSAHRARSRRICFLPVGVDRENV